MKNSIVLRIGERVRPDGTSYRDWDTLGFEGARESFAKLIRTLTPPLTMGLCGPWGSGKTEMIKALDQDLRDDGCLTLIFDAWKYRHERNLVLPLICALERRHSSKTDQIRASAKKVVTSAAVVVASSFLKRSAGVDIKDIEAVLRIYENGYKRYKKYDDSVSEVEEEYKAFIDALLQQAKAQRVVIFIDNLDRCLPDILVNLLEDISSFLSICGVSCIYLLAIDRQNVIKAINYRYPNLDGAHYLEKIVQINLNMPLPNKREQHKSSWGLYHLMKRYEWAKMHDTNSKEGDSRDQAFKQLISIDEVFQEGLLSNPRRVERFINKLMVLESAGVFQVEENPQDLPTVIFLLLLGEYVPDVYNALRNEEDVRYLGSLLTMSVQEGTTPSKMRKQRNEPNSGLVVKNESMFNAYCEDRRFFDLLRTFTTLANTNEWNKRLKQLKDHLRLVG